MVLIKMIVQAQGRVRFLVGSCVFDLTKGFPLLTTKKLYTRAIIHELLWFIKGDTNIKYLHDNKVTIGMNGLMKTATWVLFTAVSGARGLMARAVLSTRFNRL